MNKVLVIGPIFCDLLLDGFNKIPSPGEEEYLNGIRMSIGGGAITAQALAQLGVPTELLCSVGDDVFGRYMCEELRQKGIGTSLIDAEKDTNSNISIIFPSSKDRSFLTQLMKRDCISDNILKTIENMDVSAYSHIHITYPLLKNKTYKNMIRRASEMGVTISADLGFNEARAWSEEDSENLRLLDYFFPNDKEVVLITGCNDVQKAAQYFREQLSHPVITMGGSGVVLFDENNSFRRVPAPDIPVRNTTGAGDSFTAGFIYGRSCGETLVDSAVIGTICGSLTAGSPSSVSPDINRNGLQNYLSSTLLNPGEKK